MFAICLYYFVSDLGFLKGAIKIKHIIIIIADLHESSQVTAAIPESSQVTVDRHESSQVTADRPESCQVTANRPKSCHLTADRPESHELIFHIVSSPHSCSSRVLSLPVCCTWIFKVSPSMSQSGIQCEGCIIDQLT